MLRLPKLPLLSCFLALAGSVSAEPVFDYALRAGRDTNVFQDTNKLAAAFVEAEAKLRGTIDVEGSALSYGLWHRERRLSNYRFGDEHATGVSLGYKTKLSDKVEFAVEGAISREDKGDVLIAVPGSTIGYRTTDMNYSLATSLSAEFLGGKNTLTAAVNKLDHGKAKFTTDLLESTKLKANVTAFDLTASHIRPAFSGELGFTLAYRSSHIPSSEQLVLSRFPASTLRGSIAYGRKLGENITMVTELGASGIFADELGSQVKRLRPFVHTSLEWQATNILSFGTGYDQNYGITDIDDPLGEYIGTLKFAAGLQLAPKVNAKVAYEIASSEWLYYLYDTRTRRLSGTLTFDIAKNHKLELEYRRIDRTEKDPAQNFKGSQYFARMSGSF